MSLTREQKEKSISTMQKDISDANSVVFVAYDGLTVGEANDLRDKLDATGSNMRVMPKRLLKLVMKNTKIEFNPSEHEGQLAVIWGKDTVAPAKTLYEFAQENEHIKMLAGTLEGNLLSNYQVQSLAQLPSREQLIGQLVSVLAGPSRGLVQALSGVQRNAVYVLKAISDQKQEASA